MAHETIDHRFRGPPGSANGGYACGVLAGHVEGPARVTLRSPPPLDAPMQVVRGDGGVVLRHGERLVAAAEPMDVQVEVPAPVAFEDARRASAEYVGHHDHPYPSCFVCGPERAAGDGLCIWPGKVAGREVVASHWVPDRSVCDGDGVVLRRVMWAALDCPSWFGALVREVPPGIVLLGRLEARIDALPAAGDRCVAMGWPIAVDGRKVFCGSAVLRGDEVLARARATWIVLTADA